MNPHILHEDGSRCKHEGNPESSIKTGTLACPAGITVTHVEFNGQIMTIEEAMAAFLRITKAVNDMLPSLISAFSKMTEAAGQAVKTAYSGENVHVSK